MGRPQFNGLAERPADTAARVGSLNHDWVNDSCPAGGDTAGVLYENGTSSKEFLEILTCAVHDGPNKQLWWLMDIRDDSDTAQVELSFNGIQFPVIFEPAIELPAGWDVHYTVGSSESSDQSFNMTAVVRQT